MYPGIYRNYIKKLTLSKQVFCKEPFFYGTDNFDQLVKIVKVIGTKEMHDYIEKYNLNVSDLPLVSIGKYFL